MSQTISGNTSQQGAVLLPEIKSVPPGPRTKALVERDQKVMSASYTRDYPFVMERGEGCIVWDPDGNSYLDMAAGIAVCATLIASAALDGEPTMYGRSAELPAEMAATMPKRTTLDTASVDGFSRWP